MENKLGPIALLGSGETSLAGGRIFETIAGRFPQPLHIALLETPAGFELNSSRVAGKVGDYMETRLRNYRPKIDIVAARKRGTPFSPDNPEVLEPLLQADIIFMGPGSPTYAVRQLIGSLAWDVVRARHRLGAAVVFASAAVIALGACALPVYEIYKVGQDVSMLPGLDLFADFNLSLSVIPHWNNTDGGDEVDTSRCFVGLDRFTQWCSLLPPGHTVLGLDEHTGIIIDFAAGKCSISGVSSVSLLRECAPNIFPSGAQFPVTELGDFRLPDSERDGISAIAWDLVKKKGRSESQEEIPLDVARLAEKRENARAIQDWGESDRLRQEILKLGWIVQDTQEGQKIIHEA